MLVPGQKEKGKWTYTTQSQGDGVFFHGMGNGGVTQSKLPMIGRNVDFVDDAHDDEEDYCAQPVEAVVEVEYTNGFGLVEAESEPSRGEISFGKGHLCLDGGAGGAEQGDGQGTLETGPDRLRRIYCKCK